jgi:hypothetical protein
MLGAETPVMLVAKWNKWFCHPLDEQSMPGWLK